MVLKLVVLTLEHVPLKTNLRGFWSNYYRPIMSNQLSNLIEAATQTQPQSDVICHVVEYIRMSVKCDIVREKVIWFLNKCSHGSAVSIVYSHYRYSKLWCS